MRIKPQIGKDNEIVDKPTSNRRKAPMHPTIELSAWKLDASGPILREPPRPPAYRGPDYEKEFDYTTVFCDAFWSADGTSIVLIGPPLMNLKRDLGLHFESGTAGTPCNHAIDHCISVDRVEVEASADTDLLLVKSNLGEFELAPQPNLADLFRGKRVIVTKNKDNELAWIHDWALFHQKRHGCDAVLIYDTGSTRYGPQEIGEALSSIQGLDEIAVIDWPFPWGVAEGAKDSKFSQMVILEHARFRLLSGARSVLQGDVDELVLTKDGESVFQLAEGSAAGYLRYSGLWVDVIDGNGPGSAGEDVAERRHRDYCHVQTGADRKVGTKWTCVPARIRPDAQWTVNWIGLDHSDDNSKDKELTSRISLRHFKAINTGWRIGRRPESDVLDQGSHRLDRELKKALDSVFDGIPRTPIITASGANGPSADSGSATAVKSRGPQHQLEETAFRDRATPIEERRRIAQDLIDKNPNDPRLLKHFASLQVRYGDIDGAISSLRKAIELEPGFAFIHWSLGSLLARQGRIEEAITAIEAAVEMDPNHFAGHQRLSGLYAKQGRIDDAIRAARSTLSLRPNDPGLHNQLGNLLESQGAIDSAIESHRRAIELGLAGPGMHRKLAVLYARRGKYGEAIKCTRRAFIAYGARAMGLPNASRRST